MSDIIPPFCSNQCTEFNLKGKCIYWISSSLLCILFCFISHLSSFWREGNNSEYLRFIFLQMPRGLSQWNSNALLTGERNVRKDIYYGCVGRQECYKHRSWSKDIPPTRFSHLCDTSPPPTPTSTSVSALCCQVFLRFAVSDLLMNTCFQTPF